MNRIRRYIPALVFIAFVIFAVVIYKQQHTTNVRVTKVEKQVPCLRGDSKQCQIAFNGLVANASPDQLENLRKKLGVPTLQQVANTHRGPRGPIGKRGRPGRDGKDGQSIRGPRGFVGKDGPRGLQGESVRGPRGPEGPKGEKGDRGPQGQSIVGPIGHVGPPGPVGPPIDISIVRNLICQLSPFC